MHIDRRSFLATVGAAACAGTVHALVPSRGRKKRPNIVLLMSDEHRRNAMGWAGDAVARTPNLDRLAQESVRFSAAYCTNPVCTPSRASIMTGLYSHHLESQSNTTPYRPEHRTMAHHFNAAGYMTALIGKMHWVDAQTHGFEYRIEFNDWLQYLGPKAQIYADELGYPNSGSGLPEIDDLWREEGDPWQGHRTPDGREGSVAVGRVSILPEEDHFDNFVARESVRFLKNFGQDNRPFFLVTSFLKPHDPFMPAQRFANMFHAEQMKLPESWGKADKRALPREVQKSIDFNWPTPELRDPEKGKKRIALYYANLAQMDDCVGRVVRALEGAGLAEDTIICYTSDHGELLGDLGLWQKFQFYEGSCGVPLMVRVPGVRSGECQTPVSLVSLSATLTELAGVPQISQNDGVSLAPWIRDTATKRTCGPVFAEYGLDSDQPKYMVRRGEWKYTYWLHDIPELYNLRTDPAELHNLAALPEYAGQRDELHNMLFRWHKPQGSHEEAQR
jgi:choline-sulfatase